MKYLAYFIAIAIMSVAANAAPADDIPHTGDTLTILFTSDTTATSVVDQHQSVDKAGHKTAIVLLGFNKFFLADDTPYTAIAGRVAVDCQDGTMRIVTSYFLDRKGEVLNEDTKSETPDFRHQKHNTTGEKVAEYLCKQGSVTL